MKADISKPMVYILSDSVGETAELVAKAALSQFNGGNAEFHRVPYVNDAETVREVVAEAKENGGVIVYTVIMPDLRPGGQVAREAGIPMSTSWGRPWLPLPRLCRATPVGARPGAQDGCPILPEGGGHRICCQI